MLAALRILIYLSSPDTSWYWHHSITYKCNRYKQCQITSWYLTYLNPINQCKSGIVCPSDQHVTTLITLIFREAKDGEVRLRRKLGHINGGLSQAFPCFPIVGVNTCTIQWANYIQLPEKFGKVMQHHYNILKYITIITLQQCSILTLNLNQDTQSPLNISPVTQFPLWRQNSRGAQPICMGPDGAASRREPGCSCGPWQARSDKVPFGYLTSTIYI